MDVLTCTTHNREYGEAFGCDICRLTREVSELRKTLRLLRATFDTIHDRHYDNMDVVDGADGQPKPNSDMHTVTDCTVALDEIERVEPKSPPAQGTFQE